MLWPFTIILVALLASMIGCSRDVNADHPAAAADQTNGSAPKAPAPKAEPTKAMPERATSNAPAAPVVSPLERTREAAPSPINPPEPTEQKFRSVTIPAGTRLGVRLDSGVSSTTSRAEDTVEATLIRPLSLAGKEVLPSGSHLKGVVVAAAPAGKVKGRARLAIRFRTLSVDGESYPIVAQVSRVAPATKGKDAKNIGLPAAGGAVVGGIIGGKKGAAIGAAAGGGAGTAVVLSTSGEEVDLPKGSIIALRLQKAVKVRASNK
jgi:hypothetical protein